MQAADQLEAGQDVTLLASMLKLKAGRLARQGSADCLTYTVNTTLTSTAGYRLVPSVLGRDGLH